MGVVILDCGPEEHRDEDLSGFESAWLLNSSGTAAVCSSELRGWDIQKYDAMLHELKAAVDRADIEEARRLQVAGNEWLLDVSNNSPSTIFELRGQSAWWSKDRLESLSSRL